MSHEDQPVGPRGCGSMKENSFYGGADLSVSGGLHTVTWLLGDGVEGGFNIFTEVPPRGHPIINLPATITTGELWWEGMAPPQYEAVGDPDAANRYKRLTSVTKGIGVADHVGSKYYSAHSFARELQAMGPSRKMSPTVAARLAEIIYHFGPVPIMFTHSRMPVFRTADRRDEAFALAQALGTEKLPADYFEWDATWRNPRWGMYAQQGHKTGAHHYMAYLLSYVDGIDRHWSSHKDDDDWKAFRSFMKGIRFVEQPFCLSWLTKVSYTLPADKKVKPDLLKIPGLEFIDLDAKKEEENVS